MDTLKNMEYVKTMEDVDTMVTNPIIVVKENAALGAEVVVAEATVILHITVEHTECVPIQEKTAGPSQKDTKSFPGWAHIPCVQQ